MKTSDLAKNQDVLWNYDFEQKLVKNEPSAWDWAREWHTKRFEIDPGPSEVERKEVEVGSAP
jgi:hypothetical protein